MRLPLHLSEYRTKLRLFFGVFSWEARWVFAFRRRRMLTALSAGLLAVTTQGIAIGVIFLGLDSIETGLTWPMLSIHTDLKSLHGLVTFAATIAFLMLLTAHLRRRYAISINSLSIQFERALKIACLRHTTPPLVDPKACQPERIVKGSAKLSGRSLRLLLHGSLDAFQLTAFLVACLYLQPALGLFIGLILLPFLGLQWRLNTNIYHNEMEMPGAKKRASEAYGDALQQALPYSLSEAISLTNAHNISEAVQRYEWRLNATASAEYISATGAVVVTFISLIWLIHGYQDGELDAGGVAAFLLCLRALTSAAIGTSIGLASLTRLYGPVRQVHAYFRGSIAPLRQV